MHDIVDTISRIRFQFSRFLKKYIYKESNQKNGVTEHYRALAHDPFSETLES